MSARRWADQAWRPGCQGRAARLQHAACTRVLLPSTLDRPRRMVGLGGGGGGGGGVGFYPPPPPPPNLQAAADLISQCLSQDPAQRPTAREVLHRLELIPGSLSRGRKAPQAVSVPGAAGGGTCACAPWIARADSALCGVSSPCGAGQLSQGEAGPGATEEVVTAGGLLATRGLRFALASNHMLTLGQLCPAAAGLARPAWQGATAQPAAAAGATAWRGRRARAAAWQPAAAAARSRAAGSAAAASGAAASGVAAASASDTAVAAAHAAVARTRATAATPRSQRALRHQQSQPGGRGSHWEWPAGARRQCRSPGVAGGCHSGVAAAASGRRRLTAAAGPDVLSHECL